MLTSGNRDHLPTKRQGNPPPVRLSKGLASDECGLKSLRLAATRGMHSDQGAIVMHPLSLVRGLLVAWLLLCLLPATTTAAQSPVRRTFRELGHGDLTARTMYGSLTYFFPIPRGQAPQPGSQLELVISHSPLLVPDRSTMTVVVNGQSLMSAFLTPQNAQFGRLIVPLPVEHYTGGDYFVQLQFSLRLSRDTCEEAQNPALWATIHADSLLILPTQPTKVSPGLEDLSSLLFPPTSSSVRAPALVLPPDPEPAELEAAGLVGFQLGRWAAAAGQSSPLAVASEPPVGRPAIIVGGGRAMGRTSSWGSFGWDGEHFQTPGGVVPDEHGAIALRPGSPTHVLVSGGTPAAVLAAAEALVRPERRQLLEGDHVIFSGAALASPSILPWQEGAASFAQLGIGRRQVLGPGHHIVDLPITRPAGWMLRDGSALELAVEASTAVRPETSWLTVAINGQEIGTRRLETGSAAGRRYRFELPVDQLNTGLSSQPLRHLDLTLRIYLDLPQGNCTVVNPESTWAIVMPTSAWLLRHTQYTGLDLGRFPTPFLGDSTSRPLSVVLPSQPTPAELDAGLQMMAALGRWVVEPVTVLPRLTLADQLNDEERQRHHLILVGSAARNSVSAAAIRQAPGLCPSNPVPAYRLTPGERRAQLCLGQSPWGRDLAVLLVVGTEANSLSAGVAALADPKLLGQVRGQMTAIVDGLPPQPMTESNPATLPPTALAPRVEATFTERLPTWQLVGAILLGALSTMLAIAVGFRWRKRGRP